MHSQFGDRFMQVLEGMKKAVPGVGQIEVEETVDGRLVLKFSDGSFKDPFVARYVSDGTIKMFAYLLLLHDPNPHSLLCIEEPENQLYHGLLRTLIEELRLYAERDDGQVFVSTHSPEALNAATPEEVFWFIKANGITESRRVSDVRRLKREFEAGNPLGYMWRSNAFAKVHPI